MQKLTEEEMNVVHGGKWGQVAIAIAIADAAFDFYQGFKDHRK